MTGWTEILRRRVVSEPTAARAASVAMYAFGLAAGFFGIMKLIRLDLSEKELFFGVLLVVNLTMTMMLAGFVLDLMTRLAGRPDKPAGCH